MKLTLGTPFYFAPAFDKSAKALILANKIVGCNCSYCREDSAAWAAFLSHHGYPVQMNDGSYVARNGRRTGHMWLELEGQIFDPTAAQFAGADGDYEDGMLFDPHETRALIQNRGWL